MIFPFLIFSLTYISPTIIILQYSKVSRHQAHWVTFVYKWEYAPKKMLRTKRKFVEEKLITVESDVVGSSPLFPACSWLPLPTYTPGLSLSYTYIVAQYQYLPTHCTGTYINYSCASIYIYICVYICIYTFIYIHMRHYYVHFWF